MWFEEPPEVGHAVQLQHGDVPMTLNAIVDGKGECIWHDKTSRLRTAWISLAALKRSQADVAKLLIIEGLNATPDDIHRLKGGSH